MIEVIIDEIKNDDVDAYRNLRLEMVERHPYAFDVDISALRELSPDDWRLNVAGCADNPNHNRFLAKTEFNATVGMIGCLIKNGIVEIGSFYVQEHYSGKGIGALLLARSIEFGTSQKVTQQSLWVSSESKFRKWYVKEGFKPTNPRTERNWHDGSQKEEMLVRHS